MISSLRLTSHDDNCSGCWLFVHYQAQTWVGEWRGGFIFRGKSNHVGLFYMIIVIFQAKLLEVLKSRLLTLWAQSLVLAPILQH